MRLMNGVNVADSVLIEAAKAEPLAAIEYVGKDLPEAVLGWLGGDRKAGV